MKLILLYGGGFGIVRVSSRSWHAARWCGLWRPVFRSEEVNHNFLFQVTTATVGRTFGTAQGYRTEDVGSFGLLLNLPGSDLDLAIGVPSNDQERVLEVLRREEMRFKGERQTSATSNRKVFEIDFEDLQVDVGVLPKDDFDLLLSSLKRCVAEMTDHERVEHVWRKWNLKQEGRREEYAQLKLEPYARFCPSFIWTPIL